MAQAIRINHSGRTMLKLNFRLVKHTIATHAPVA